MLSKGNRGMNPPAVGSSDCRWVFLLVAMRVLLRRDNV
jgi:hypothetical protein